MVADNASPATRQLADVLADFCDARAAQNDKSPYSVHSRTSGNPVLNSKRKGA
jgi:hypothetical protein